jgi:hypothetical protein
MTSAILDPTGLSNRPKAPAFTLASRPTNLSAGEATLRRKEIFSQPAPPELIDELGATSEVVVVGIGD